MSASYPIGSPIEDLDTPALVLDIDAAHLLFHPPPREHRGKAVRGARHALQAVKCEVWGGFVFINMDLDAAPLAQYLNVMPEHFRHFPLERRRIKLHVQKILPANWKAAQEAFMEAYHNFETHDSPNGGNISGNRLGELDITGSGNTFGAGQFQPRPLRLVEKVHTGEVPARPVTRGGCTEIATGAPMPDLTVELGIFDQTSLLEQRTAKTDGAGVFRLTDLPTDAGLVFAGRVEYQGMPSSSDFIAFEPGRSELNLPLSVFETTTDASGVRADRDDSRFVAHLGAPWRPWRWSGRSGSKDGRGRDFGVVQTGQVDCLEEGG